MMEKVVNSATVMLLPLEEQLPSYINGIGIGVNDHYTAELADTTNAGQDTGTASHEQLPYGDIVEININGGESVQLNRQFSPEGKNKHKCKTKNKDCSSDKPQQEKTKMHRKRVLDTH